MNKQNFESKDRFPLSTQSLSFMQDMIVAAAGLSRIGGDNYILSGCTKTGNNVSAGVLVVAGEIMPFDGGVEGKTITIVETPKSISANGLTFENARVVRKAVFASGSGVNYLSWSDFKPLATNEQLEKAKATIKYVDDEIAKIQAGAIPSGVIVMWSGAVTNIPEGWQLCNGGPIGTTGKYTPNLSGRFVVGYSPEESLGYTKLERGGKNPDQYNITLLPNQLPVHSHEFDDYFRFDDADQSLVTDSIANGKTIMSNSGTLRNDGSKSDTMYYKTHNTKESGEGGGIDIRPPYYVLAYIIKL